MAQMRFLQFCTNILKISHGISFYSRKVISTDLDKKHISVFGVCLISYRKASISIKFQFKVRQF